MQNGLLLILPFGVAMVSWPLAKSIGLRFDIMDYPNNRKIHAIPTLRTGGVIILLAYLSGLFLWRADLYPEYRPFTLSAVFLFLLGIVEDKYCLGPKLRLLFQASVVCFFVFSTNVAINDIGVFAIPWLLQVPFTVFAIVGVINAFNIIDGMNGLSSGLGIISASFLGILAFLQGNIEVATLAILFVGSLLGFLFFNMRGKIFMGDSGSYLMGFVVSALSVMLVVYNHEVSPFAPLLIILIPVFDTLFAIYRRKRLNRSPFIADKRHLHHILSRRYKNNTKAVVVILLLQTVIALLTLLFYKQTYVLIGVAFLFSLFLRRLWFKTIKLGNVRL